MMFHFLGELLNQLKQLDTDVTHSLLDVSRKLNSQDGSKEVNPFIQFKKLLLSSAGQKEFDTLVSSIQEGMVSMLCWSFINIWKNSVKMHKIFM
jgi:hypothetical protein